jgi:FAD/FMN-containing dehydrogenase
LLADIGSGIVYVRCDAELEYLEHIQSITPRPVFLALPEPLKSGLDVFGGADEGAATLLRRLKNEYDPTAIFNQGRFVLGL